MALCAAKGNTVEYWDIDYYDYRKMLTDQKITTDG
jgi:hypothetical protein